VLAAGTAAAVAADDPFAPRQEHTAADMASAQKLTLRRDDLGQGWTAATPAKNEPPCKGAPDESKLVQTAKVDPSWVWQDGVTTVGSEVDIFATEPEALKDWQLSTFALLKRCLLQSAQHSVGTTASVSITGGGTLKAPAGAKRALHYRLVFAVKSKTRTVSLVSDVVALGRGRVTVVLHTITAVRPLPASVLNSLVGTLRGRLNVGHTS